MSCRVMSYVSFTKAAASHLQIKGELPTRQHSHEHHMLQLPEQVGVVSEGVSVKKDNIFTAHCWEQTF